MLLDFVYNHIDFNGEAFRAVSSKIAGDGGLDPGRLVFLDDLERFSGKPFETLIGELTGNREPDAYTLGGPAAVSLIHAMQLLGEQAECTFVAAIGTDSVGEKIRDILDQTPLNDARLIRKGDRSPFTNVLSDPNYHDGHGERSFINNIGAAAMLTPSDLPESFYDAEVMALGGTALVPGIHDALEDILSGTPDHVYTIVNTVYDFRSEQQHPGQRWPLGEGSETLDKIDLLIMDREEAEKISGQQGIDRAMRYFRKHSQNSFIITDGVHPVHLYSPRTGVVTLPVSNLALKSAREIRNADTTGAGDNFAGGVIYSIAKQIHGGTLEPDLVHAAMWGVVSGGMACSYIGGTFLEAYPGEKRKKLESLFIDYEQQVKGSGA